MVYLHFILFLLSSFFFSLFFFVYSAGKIITKGMVKNDRTQHHYREGKCPKYSKAVFTYLDFQINTSHKLQTSLINLPTYRHNFLVCHLQKSVSLFLSVECVGSGVCIFVRSSSNYSFKKMFSPQLLPTKPDYILSLIKGKCVLCTG